ncbi:rRNA maturation RNase YbeY [Poseidonocella sedimentorum]|uniref:Endoribonuclease YbeY n=1 Tax=Poseidonocella sedimentorum TaxID=871652 RepID=A0A1I6DPU5_9RHOB|nr:rRNA maturation RNase YbeY [Poseidonocella sedimentorum]SFR07503.1 probable rRNA maturation factor [Poseidonocella sedimentorum]
MIVETMIEEARWAELELEALAERAAAAALVHLGLGEAWEISLLACNDARVAELNGEFRAKDQPTNVLSWPSEERGAEADGGAPIPPDPAGDPELGDIAIAWETCAREADAAGKPMADHVTHLVVHAVLHLLGYDHTREADATLMEDLEREILGKLGLPDPYSLDNGV